MKNKIVIALIFAAAVCLFSSCVVRCASCEEKSAGDPDWLMTESDNFKVYYRSNVNLETIERALRKKTSYLGGKADRDVPVEERVGQRLDFLLGRAKDILGMWHQMPKISVRIFKDRGELSDEYVRIFGDRKDYKSFYVHKYETIYTSEEDITDSIVAHEMGHAIIDHYFAIVPPPKVAEVLASYVDLHLSD